MTVPREPAPFRVMDLRWWWWGVRKPFYWAQGHPLDTPQDEPVIKSAPEDPAAKQEGAGKPSPKPFRFDPLRFALGLQVRRCHNGHN